uniref:Uncharacterized protein n=1 Tax=Ciona savignyi TaxID=51511 RepID=H2Z5B6_CIOSA
MKQERSENASASKQAEDSTASNDTGRIPHNDSLSTAHRRFNAGGPHSNPRNVTLPSGYIPSNERVQNKAKQPPISTVVPSINIENNDEKQDDTTDTEDGGDE